MSENQPKASFENPRFRGRGKKDGPVGRTTEVLQSAEKAKLITVESQRPFNSGTTPDTLTSVLENTPQFIDVITRSDKAIFETNYSSLQSNARRHPNVGSSVQGDTVLSDSFSWASDFALWDTQYAIWS